MTSANGTVDSPKRTLSRTTPQRFDEAVELRNHYWGQYDPARSRIDEARRFISKETRAPLTTDFALAGVDAGKFGAGLPQQMTTALRLRNFLSERVPALGWHAGRRAGISEEIATDLEQWGEAAMELTYPYVQATDVIQNEGEGGVIIRPETLAWSKTPKPDEVSVDERGRAETDRYYRNDRSRTYQKDESRSASAYQKRKTEYLGRHFPMKAEIVSLTDAAPINPQWQGTGPKARVTIDGLIVERAYTVSELLKRRICWWENGRLISPETQTGGGSSTLRLLEEWITDEDGLPWVTYTVTDGATAHRTQKLSRDGTRLVDHQVDLFKEYGLRTLPVAWEYGWHWGVTDVGKRSVPFVFPFIEAFLTAMTMLSGISVHTLLTGFGGWFVLRDQRTPQLKMASDAAELKAPSDEPIRVGAFEVVELEARDVRPAVHSGPSPEAGKLIEFMLRQIADAGPPPGAFGGAAENALDRTTMMKQTAAAVGDITNGNCRLYGRAASLALELGCAIGRTYDLEVPVPSNVEVPNAGSGAGQYITLHHEDVSEIYDYHAEYPTKPGDNLALAAQLWGFYSGPKPGITFDEWREWSFGDRHPEVTMGKMIADQIQMGPLGIQDVLEYVARRIGDEAMQEKLKAMQTGDLFPDGTPDAMLAGVPEGVPGLPPGMPAGQPPGMPGGGDVGAQMAAAATGMPNAGNAQMAAQIGAAMQQSANVAAVPGGGLTGTPGA